MRGKVWIIISATSIVPFLERQESMPTQQCFDYLKITSYIFEHVVDPQGLLKGE